MNWQTWAAWAALTCLSFVAGIVTETLLGEGR